MERYLVSAAVRHSGGNYCYVSQDIRRFATPLGFGDRGRLDKRSVDLLMCSFAPAYKKTARIEEAPA